MTQEHYDVVAVGIGPFNLGLAALASQIPGLSLRCFERSRAFDWHAGMMIEGTSLQVSFLADLVTLVDPCSPHSYLAYVKQSGRLYQFAIREAHYIGRGEYNRYCRWVAENLPSLEFGNEVTAIEWEAASDRFRVEVRNVELGRTRYVRARNVVLGVGSVPWVPDCARSARSAQVLHSAEYLPNRERLLSSPSIALVGSGQSAAEIFYDLLQHKAKSTRLTWLTRSARFFPMDYSKLALEMASPDYIDHFFGLRSETKQRVLAGQDVLYKGINLSLIDGIYDALYDRSVERAPDDVRLATNCELQHVSRDGHDVNMGFLHRETGEPFAQRAQSLVLATGYRYRVPACLGPLRPSLHWDERGRYVVDRNYGLAGSVRGLYVQNAELHTHGFTASDLSVGPYRNATILNAVLGYERFSLERRIAFQDFGAPRDFAGRPAQPTREPAGKAGLAQKLAPRPGDLAGEA